MAKGVAHAGKGKSLSSGEARENERRGWTEKSYRRKNESQFNNYDWSRHNLNFEIVDGKIAPLGSQKVSLYNRYHNVLNGLDWMQYKDGATNQQHTYVELILSGSTEKMQGIAFGDQKVDYTRNPEQWQNWGVKRRTGKGSIEQWALDVYDFVCKKYGKENIIGFEVHLDETEPHVHCNIVPTAIMKQRGNVSGYHKVETEIKEGKVIPKLDEDGNTIPATYKKGKHIGEVIKISDKKYDALSDEKKQEYRKNERGTVRTISYATYFGDKLNERSAKLSQLHDDFYAEVGIKWGFERGDVIALLPPEERAKRIHMTKAQRWKLIQTEKMLSEQKTAIEQQGKQLKEAEAKTEQANEKARKAVDAKEAAENELQAQENTKAENQRTIDQQNQTIAGQKQDIISNTAMLDVVNRNLADATDKVDAKRQELTDIEGDVKTAQNDLTAIKKQKDVLQKDIDVMAKVDGLVEEKVGTYVQAFQNMPIVITDDIRKKLISPIKDHPATKSEISFKNLRDMVQEELGKVIMDKGSVWNPVTKEERNERMKAVITDMTTILILTVGAKQKSDIARAQGELYKAARREVAKAASATVKVGELEREGVKDVAQVKDLKKTAGKAEAAEDMLEFAWPGITKARNTLIDPSLDKNYMTDEQKANVRSILRKKPESRLKDITKLIDYAGKYRDIPAATRAEAIETAAEDIVKGIASEKGYDLVKEATSLIGDTAKELEMSVADAAVSTAAAAACLFFGYLDAATTVSEGCGGGGGGNNDLPKKKDDEDERKFLGRCLMTAAGMMKPKQRSRSLGGRN